MEGKRSKYDGGGTNVGSTFKNGLKTRQIFFNNVNVTYQKFKQTAQS